MRILLITSILVFLQECAYAQRPTTALPVDHDDSLQFVLMEGSDVPGNTKVIRRIDRFHNVLLQPASGSLANRLQPLNNSWKKIGYLPRGDKRFYIRSTSDITNTLTKANIRVVAFHKSSNTIEVEATWEELEKDLLSHPAVMSIQHADRIPIVESRIRRHNLSINGIRRLHNEKPDLKGINFNCSIKEDAFDQNDLDIATRAFLDANSSILTTSHATDVATLVGGAGNSYTTGKGVANAVNLYSESFESLLPQSNNYFIDKSITVQNHSYGVGVENFYGIESVAFDRQALEIPWLLHVFSAGNSGLSEGSGIYDGLTGVANITGSFKQAKNVMVVTASAEDGLVPAVNSGGPAYDGRIRPELTAFGGEGTSDAAALVSGAAILIQEQFKIKEGILPNADMVRALLLAGASDLEAPGPDFRSGYGAMNLPHTIAILDSGWYAGGKLLSDETTSFNIVVSTQKRRITVALVWRDPPANEGDYMALVNDLDLHISSGAETWLPWILDSTPDLAALSARATFGEDHLNNVEVVTIENADIGTYTVHISANKLTDEQEFSIAYYLEDEENFKWVYPTGGDALLAGKETFLYWENNINKTGLLEIEFLNDKSEVISSQILSDTKFIPFIPPAIYTQAVLRMNLGGTVFESDTFTINPSNNVRVDLNCPDQFVLSWDHVDDEVLYEVLAYTDGALKPIVVTNDTSVLFTKVVQKSLYYTVRTIGQPPGLADETIRIDQQGVGCFLSNFIATLTVDAVVEIRLELSGLNFIDSVKIIKETGNVSETIYIDTPSTAFVEIRDPDILPGKTTYQAVIFPHGLDAIESEEIPIFFTDDKTFLLFPNPVYEDFVYFLSPESNSIFQVLNSVGQLIYEFEIVNELETFPLNGYVPGIYLYRVIKDDAVVKVGRFIKL